MKYFFCVFFIVLVALFSCNNSVDKLNQTSFTLFNEDSLNTQLFTIDVNNDTLLKTLHGAWLKIAKGTFTTDSGTTAAIEIKEAYSIQQIIKAGLVTQSNGQPLSSGGMIYINAAGGKKVTINKPIKIALPTDFIDKNMQVFKGVKDNSGNINWVEPKPMDQSKQLTTLQKGEVYFQQKCASCHGIGNEGSGPDLANILKRDIFKGEGQYWLGHRFYSSASSRPGTVDLDSSNDWSDGFAYDHTITDPYVCNLVKLYNNKAVNLSQDFEKDQQDWINTYEYIENESNRRNLPFPKHAYLDSCLDSCNMYNNVKWQLEKKKEEELTKRKELIEENGSMVIQKPDPTWRRNDAAPPADLSDKVKPNNFEAQYYQFTIETFGWFNIDVLLASTGAVESELFVRIRGSYIERIKIYLIIPSVKVLGEGGPSDKNKDEYSFFKKDGKIPLPQNTKAYILAVTESEDNIAFALKEFITGLQQTIDLALIKATKEAFDQAIETIPMDNISIKVQESRYAQEICEADKTIKQLEEELIKAQNLKPTRCDCECGQTKLAAVDSIKYERVLAN